MLYTIYNMRSSDVWLGVPYDWFSFSCLSAYVVLLLRRKYPELRLGLMSYNAASCHMYVDNFANWAALDEYKVRTVTGLFPERYNSPEEFLDTLLRHTLKDKDNPDIFSGV
jgi:thymidylate synthase